MVAWGRQAADPPNVIVSGWQVYDNKGRVVEKADPGFSKGFDYLSPAEEQARFGRNVLGQRVTMFYDPIGQVIGTVNPDGSEQRVVFGAPGTILDPNLGNPDGVRLRTDAARRVRYRNNALYLVFKMVERLSGHWRALNGGENLMAMVLEGWVFKDGVRQPRDADQRAPAAA